VFVSAALGLVGWMRIPTRHRISAVRRLLQLAAVLAAAGGAGVQTAAAAAAAAAALVSGS